MKYIQGDDRYQPTFLPPVLDDYINEDNPVRVIDAFVDNLDITELGFAKSKTSDTGRPPYSPSDMLKLYIYGYFNKVRSSRKLETETYRNVEVMWLLNNLKPDHKTISRFRKDNPAPIKGVFDRFVKLCLKMNLYNRQLISIDGSQFAVVNSKERNYSVGKMQDRIARINKHISEYLIEIEMNDSYDNKIPDSENVTEIVAKLKARKTKYEDMLNKMDESGETQISLTDPDSRLLTKLNSHKMAYNVQTAVDGSMKKSDFSKEYNNADLKLKQIHYVPDKELLKRRKSLSEHPFGIVKRCLGADYLLLKGFSGVRAEMALAYLAFNMKRAINILGIKPIIQAINIQ